MTKYANYKYNFTNLWYNIDMVKNNKSKSLPVITNRRATFDYALEEDLVAGIALTGPETRAARDGHIQLKGSFVTIKDSELWLNNASFSLKHNEKNNPSSRTIDTSPRKLLVTRKQIDDFTKRRQAGYSIIPTKLLTGGRFIKVVIAIGKGKKTYDKRETIKRRDQERDAKRAIKNL